MSLFYVILIIVDEKKVISKNLLISILAGFFNILFSIYIIIMGNHGYVDKATGVFVYETYYLTVLDFIIIFLFTPCFLICMIAGISSIVNDFKVNERKRAIITIFGLILLLFFNFGGITFISNIFGPQKEAKEKAKKCEQSNECYKNNEIAICMYKNEEVECPLVMVEKR